MEQHGELVLGTASWDLRHFEMGGKEGISLYYVQRLELGKNSQLTKRGKQTMPDQSGSNGEGLLVDD